MATTSLYMKLVKKSALMFGELPGEEQVAWAIAQCLPEEDLRVYFLIPFGSQIPLKKLQAKAARLGYTPETLQAALDRMFREAFVMRHETASGPAYESCPLSMAAEQQVRMKKGTPVGKAFGDYWLSLASISAYKLPTKTPYFRILPVESTINPVTSQPPVASQHAATLASHGGAQHAARLQTETPLRIEIKRAIPAPGEILPLDAVSELVRNQALIGVAECYCRASLDMQDDHCSKPRETCFVFNEFATSLIELGVARRLDLNEALQILRDCERAGLVHNADNFQGQIRGLCNCCACHCPGLKAASKGLKNVEAVSHYRVVFEPEKCIQDHACLQVCPVGALSVQAGGLPQRNDTLCLGCGLCVSACPEEALHMVVRDKAPQVPVTPKALQNALMREAVVGLVWNKIRGKR